MGKKSTLKKIRAIAGSLPVIMRQTHEKHIVTGADLLSDGIKQVEGKPIIEDNKYMQPYPVMIAINHARAMKKLYNQYGATGVRSYMDAVKKHVEQKAAKELTA